MWVTQLFPDERSSILISYMRGACVCLLNTSFVLSNILFCNALRQYVVVNSLAYFCYAPKQNIRLKRNFIQKILNSTVITTTQCESFIQKHPIQIQWLLNVCLFHLLFLVSKLIYQTTVCHVKCNNNEYQKKKK